MPAKYVRPYSKGQKNDFRDAEAIAEAVQRPTMKFVATKTADQLDLQALHRVRERLVSQRTGIINQIRAFLLERGIAVRQGQRFLRAELPMRPTHSAPGPADVRCCPNRRQNPAPSVGEVPLASLRTAAKTVIHPDHKRILIWSNPMWICGHTLPLHGWHSDIVVPRLKCIPTHGSRTKFSSDQARMSS